MTEFEKYKLIHNFVHNEPLKGWINEDTYQNYFFKSWDGFMEIVEAINNRYDAVLLDFTEQELKFEILVYDESGELHSELVEYGSGYSDMLDTIVEYIIKRNEIDNA